MEPSCSLYAIGHNSYGEFGNGSKQTLTQLTKLSNCENISNVYCGCEFTIFRDDKGKDQSNVKFFAAGNNETGSCALVKQLKFGVSTQQDFDSLISKSEGHKVWKEPVMNRKSIQFFATLNINISKVCVNVNRACVFWISESHQVYANGRNMYGKLGLGDNEDRFYPEPVDYLNELPYTVTDLQSTYNHTFALCLTNNQNVDIIILNWTRSEFNSNVIIPDAVSYLVILFYCINKVLHSTMDGSWKEIEMFEVHNVVKIKTGYSHSLLLDSNGCIWCYGDNGGRFGTDEVGSIWFGIDDPIQIPYFRDNKIRIKDIKCGENHSLAVDEHMRVWSWGYNEYGQCGTNKQHETRPRLISGILDNHSYPVIQIECGYNHSYVKLKNELHFMFGSNEYNECITYDDRENVMDPFCINDIVAEKTEGRIIKSVSLGCNCTMIIMKHSH